jgi:hypothetical protein
MPKPSSKPSPSSSSNVRNTDTADYLKKRVATYYKRKRRVCFLEIGVNRGGRLRADVFVLAMSGHIVIVEVKSSVADFRSDLKWPNYQDYCNQFYFAFTKLVYEKVKEQIPKGVGVFVFDAEDGRLKPRVIRAKNFDLDPDIQRSLYIRAAFRNSDTSNRKNRRA